MEVLYIHQSGHDALPLSLVILEPIRTDVPCTEFFAQTEDGAPDPADDRHLSTSTRVAAACGFLYLYKGIAASSSAPHHFI